MKSLVMKVRMAMERFVVGAEPLPESKSMGNEMTGTWLRERVRLYLRRSSLTTESAPRSWSSTAGDSRVGVICERMANGDEGLLDSAGGSAYGSIGAKDVIYSRLSWQESWGCPGAVGLKDSCGREREH